MKFKCAECCGWSGATSVEAGGGSGATSVEAGGGSGASEVCQAEQTYNGGESERQGDRERERERVRQGGNNFMLKK